MRSEFQDVFKDAYDHWIDDACSQRYYASRNLALQVWQHQQSKVDELQKNNTWLSGVACRENKRANKLQEENVNTTVLLGKTIQEKNELQKRLDALSLALDKIAHPIPYMQKEADLNGCELNGYWAVKMSEDHTYSKDIARKALEKEQALKGGYDE